MNLFIHFDSRMLIHCSDDCVLQAYSKRHLLGSDVA